MNRPSLRIHAITLGSLVSTLSGPAASGAVITFDGYPTSTVLTTQYAGLGVTFSASTTAFISDIISQGAGYNTSSPPNIAYADWNGQVQGTLRADFATPASAVSFFAIDVGESSRDCIAYDSFNNPLQTITIVNPGSGPGIGMINPVVFTVSNIAYITFGQGSTFGAGDGSGIDDLSFTLVPAPGGAALLALAALATTRRRR